MKDYWVYMLTNSGNRVLYTGVTNRLARRLSEHRAGTDSSFTKKYRLHKLVFAESTSDIHAAITREKQIKGWLRSKKNALIVSINPLWEDLGQKWNLLACHPEHSEGSLFPATDSSLRSE
jgi:putative endonuclease